MGFDAAMFWFFLAAVTVASLTFIAVIVWAENRRRERQDYYRFEFRKRMVEAGKMDSEGLASLMRYEHDLGMQQSRQKMKVAGFVITGVGVGLCLGFQFITGSIWMLGLIPLSVGIFMLLYGLVVATTSDPGSPPAGWSPDAGAKG